MILDSVTGNQDLNASVVQEPCVASAQSENDGEAPVKMEMIEAEEPMEVTNQSSFNEMDMREILPQETFVPKASSDTASAKTENGTFLPIPGSSAHS